MGWGEIIDFTEKLTNYVQIIHSEVIVFLFRFVNKKRPLNPSNVYSELQPPPHKKQKISNGLDTKFNVKLCTSKSQVVKNEIKCNGTIEVMDLCMGRAATKCNKTS